MSYRKPECYITGGLSYELPGTTMVHYRRYILWPIGNQNGTLHEAYPMSYREPEWYITRYGD